MKSQSLKFLASAGWLLFAAATAFAVAPTRYFEYVQAASDLYVDIGAYTPKNTTVIETDVTVDNPGANATIFCSRGTSKTSYTLFYIAVGEYAKDYFRFDYADKSYKSGTLEAVAGDRYLLRTSPTELKIDGQLAATTGGLKPYEPDQRMILFGSYSASTSKYAPSGNYSRMKMYSFKIYDRDEDDRLVLIHDFLPAEVDGAVGLYDRLADAFYKSPVKNQLVAGPEITLDTSTISLRSDVVDNGYEWSPNGVTTLQPYTVTNLFDGYCCSTSVTSWAMNSRWIGNDSSVLQVDIESDYFSLHGGNLISYGLYKCPMTSYALNARAPDAWRLEGVPAGSANDEDWQTIDTRTGVVWPNVDQYVYTANEEPQSAADSKMEFSIPSAKRRPYRRLRFVPTDSAMKRYNPSEPNAYSLEEVDFRTADELPGMPSDTLVLDGAPEAYGDPSFYGVTNGLSAGATVLLSAPASAYANEDETLRAICTGWKLYTYDMEKLDWVHDADDPAARGTGNTLSYVHPTPAAARKIEWQFKLQAYVETTTLGSGTASGSGWYDVGSTAAISVVPSEGLEFRHWNGLPAAADNTTASASFTVTGPCRAEASIGGFRWVATSGSDDNPGTESEPFLTIAKAVADLGVAGGTVTVGAGTYVEQEDETALAALTLTNEVAIIGATGRPEDVVIKHRDTDKTRHNVHLDNAYAKLRYLTITGGKNWSQNWGNNDFGFNVRIGEKGGIVEDCILSGVNCGNFAQQGQCLHMKAGRVSRCRFINNRNTSGYDNIYGTALYASAGLVEDCLFASNTCYSASTVFVTGSAALLNCTVADNGGTAYSGVHVGSTSASVVNCIVYGNTVTTTSFGSIYRGETQRFFNCYFDLDLGIGTNCVVGTSPFVAPGDYRIAPGSRCFDAGADISACGAVSATDLAGLPRVAGAAVDIGCHETSASELSCGFTWSAESYLAPATVTLTAAASGAVGAPTYAWSLSNEVTGAVANYPAGSAATFQLADLAAGTYAVALAVAADEKTASHTVPSAFTVGPRDVYAKAGNLDAAFPYATVATAAADLASALAASVDGSTVHVLDGTYEIASELVVTKGVTIVGASGHPASAVVRRASGNVRIFGLDHASAFVANLTIADGLSPASGGCVRIGPSGGTVSNCVIRGGRTVTNKEYHAGGVHMYAGLVTHCRVTDCMARSPAADTWQSRVVSVAGGRLSNCLITECHPTESGPIVSVTAGGAVMENCTVAGCSVRDGSTSAEAVVYATVRNCAIFATNTLGEAARCGGAATYAHFWPTRYVNCVSGREFSAYVTSNGGKGWYYGSNCISNAAPSDCFANAAAGDYRVKPDGLLVNAGMNGVGLLPATDLGGHPRIYRDTIDIGCYEDYSRAITVTIR